MNKCVVFRLDAGSNYGLGHFSRCFALAQQLIEKQIQVIFYIYGNLNPVLFNKLTYNEIDIRQVDSPNSLVFLDDLKKNDVLIIDSYELTDIDLSKIKSNCKKLIIIDDFDKEYNGIDALVNTSISSSKVKTPHYKQFLGIEYALLRKEFLAPAKQSQRKGILISIGGSDPKNITTEVIDVLLSLNVSEPIYVLYTLSYSSVQCNYFLHLAKKKLIHPEVNLEPHRIVQLMDKCKYGIFSSSNILLEALKRNIICGFGYYTDNQKNLYTTLIKYSAGVDFGLFEKNNLKQNILKLFNQEIPNNFLFNHISSKLNELVNFILE